MSSKLKLAAVTFPLITGLVLVAGCSQGDATHSDARKAILIQSEPAEPKSITEAKDLAVTPVDVSVRGRIDAGDFSPFKPDVAAFMLAEIIEDEHGGDPSHDADNCPFCKRRAEQAPRAEVVLVDEQGQPFGTGADQLLDLAKGDTVVVSGSAQWNDTTELLQITAKKLFVSP